MGGLLMKGFRVLLLLLAAPFICFEPGMATAENVLRWASVAGAATFDPHGYDEPQTAAQYRQVYEALIGFDSDLELVPQLATTWRLVGPTTWEFRLRPNVRFHDGTPFTARDVVFSFARAKTELPVGFAGRIGSIAEVRAIDDHTVHMETKFPDPQLWDDVRFIYIMSEAWAAAHDAEVPVNVSAGEENYASRHANGTGPFIAKEFEPGGAVVMVRNPDWWGFERYPDNIDRIQFTPIADPEARLAALLRGDLDLLTDPPFTALERIRSTPGLEARASARTAHGLARLRPAGRQRWKIAAQSRTGSGTASRTRSGRSFCSWLWTSQNGRRGSWRCALPIRPVTLCRKPRSIACSRPTT
jgi:peptide/nickel transport system substrate-binding protein